MLQEQVSEYLGVTSFKRKYPGMSNKLLSAGKILEFNGFHVIGQIVVLFSGWVTDDEGEVWYFAVNTFFISNLLPDLERRDLSHKEKLYLREQNVITETQCTLGKILLIQSFLFSFLFFFYLEFA